VARTLAPMMRGPPASGPPAWSKADLIDVLRGFDIRALVCLAAFSRDWQWHGLARRKRRAAGFSQASGVDWIWGVAVS